MDKNRYSAKFATIAGAAVLLSLAAIPARAQAPGGSYLESCTHVRSSGDRVIADCRRVDGSWNRAELGGAQGCVGGIANTNGQLTCNHAGRDYGEMRRHPGSDRRYEGSGSSWRHDRNDAYYGR